MRLPRGEGGADSGAVLLERERELAVIDASLARADAGRGSLVAIEGEPGIGKSTLLGAARNLAEARGMAAASSHGEEGGRGLAFALLRELAEGVGEPASGERPTESLLPDGAPPPELLVSRRFAQLVEAAATRRPLLLVADDLHWADLSSLRALLHLARRIAELPVAICVATRPATDGEPLPAVLDALLLEAGEWLLLPAPLGGDACATLVECALGEAADLDFSGACREATGGNPLLLRELLRGLAAERVEPASDRVAEIPGVGGSALERAVRLRLAPLPASARRLAGAAAVLGEERPLAEAAAVADLDGEFEAAAETLTGAEILAGGGRARFSHPLIREAVLCALPALEAEEMHATAARLLAERGAPPQRLAPHLLRTHPRGSAETTSILRQAAAAAAASGDMPAAARLLERALEEPPPTAERAAVLLELAAVQHFVDHAAANQHAAAALRLIDDPDEAAVAALRLGEMLPVVDPEAALTTIKPHVERLGDGEARLRAYATMLTAAALRPGLLAEGRRIAARLGPEREGTTTAARMARAALAYLAALENRPAEGVVAEIEAVASPLDPPEVLGQLCLAAMALVAADAPVALTLGEEWLALAERSGLPGEMTGALMCRAHALLARGRLEEALVEARSGAEVAELYVGGVALRWVAAALVEVLIEAGEVEEATRALRGVAPTVVPKWTPDLHGLLGCEARLEALRGDRAASLRRLLELGRLCEEAELRNPALAPWRSRAALLLCEGEPRDVERGRALAAEEVELARTWGAPRALGRALSAQARLAAGREEALELHEEAVAVLEDSPARLELARAALEQGVALRNYGAGAAARAPLGCAAELAEACGAAPLLSRAREELLATGARPRRTALSGPGSLTPQERRVTALAAGGVSNPEIAERLYLSTRTVESHLANAYRKLDISSRSQLAAALGPGAEATPPPPR